METCNRVVFQSMLSEAVQHNDSQYCMRNFIFFHIIPPLQQIQQKYML